MQETLNPSYLLVDLSRLRRNVEGILAGLPQGVSLIPVLKDDAYGLGLTRVGRLLAGYRDISAFAVACVSEGLALRRAGAAQDVLVMGGTPSYQLPAAVKGGLTLAAGRLGFLPLVGQAARAAGVRAKVQIKIETGLHRLGLAPGEELSALIRELARLRDCVEVTGAFSHFADLEDAGRTARQYDAFLAGVAQLEGAGIPVPCRHISGSAAWERFPQYRLDGVRIGRRLYMDHPTRPLGGVEEVAAWRGYLTNLRRLRQGDHMGYGGRFRLEKDTLAATVSVGYGDGLNQALVRAQAPVLVGGKQGKLLACCMDQCLVDVTGIDCAPDDEVTFFGWDRAGNVLSAQAVSLLAGEDEGCGLTSALSGRVARVYEGE